MIPGANAVVYPRTVMIKSGDAFVADVAMPASRGTYYLTFRTQHVRVK